jgi:hypothetical protein
MRFLKRKISERIQQRPPDLFLLDIKVYRGIKIVKAGEFLLMEGSPHS